VATILSAQCTDEMVNRVTPALFERFPDPQALAAADSDEVARYIRPTGFYQQKTRAIQAASRHLVESYGGAVPASMAALTSLHGVGRKTANVLIAAAEIESWPGWEDLARRKARGRSARAGEKPDALGPDDSGPVVDTHVIRLSQRLDLSRENDAVKIERDLARLLLRSHWSTFPLRLIFHGRQTCTAARPACPTCPLRPFCPSAETMGSPPWMRPRRALPARGAGGAK